MTRYAFYIDLSICAGCESCTVACQTKNELDYSVEFTKIRRYETGTFPDMKSTFTFTQCMHCDVPPCEAVCPTGATYKTAEGPVMVEYDKCIACKYCITACPYDARTYDEKDGVVKKCTECVDRLVSGQQPACVQTCITGARMVGDLDNPNDAIHKALAEKDVFKVDGTSFYLKAPSGIGREVLPQNFQAAGITFAWQSILQPVGQLMLGGVTTALLASAAANAVKALRKGGDDEHGSH